MKGKDDMSALIYETRVDNRLTLQLTKQQRLYCLQQAGPTGTCAAFIRSLIDQHMRMAGFTVTYRVNLQEITFSDGDCNTG